MSTEVTIDRIRFEDEVTDGDWAHRLWRFDICIGPEEGPSRERVISNSPFRTGMALDEPSSSDILESLAMDLQSVQGYDDWMDWAEELDGLTSAKATRESRDAFQKISIMRTLFEEYGVDVEAFIEQHADH